VTSARGILLAFAIAVAIPRLAWADPGRSEAPRSDPKPASTAKTSPRPKPASPTVTASSRPAATATGAKPQPAHTTAPRQSPLVSPRPATLAPLEGVAPTRHPPVKQGLGGPMTYDPSKHALVVLGGTAMRRKGKPAPPG
jgi:hypothetical protein